MKQTTHLRTVTAVAALVLLAACGSNETTHARYEGTPSDWYSGSYMTVLQEESTDAPATSMAFIAPAKKPVRMRIF